MKHRYEGLLILNVKGSDEGVKEIIEHLEGDFKTEGATIEQVQKMDRRQFTYVAGPLDSGYYVNFIFSAEPDAIAHVAHVADASADLSRSFESALVLRHCPDCTADFCLHGAADFSQSLESDFVISNPLWPT
jgi:small subunit ribosomal protein S6